MSCNWGSSATRPGQAPLRQRVGGSRDPVHAQADGPAVRAGAVDRGASPARHRARRFLGRGLAADDAPRGSRLGPDSAAQRRGRGGDLHYPPSGKRRETARSSLWIGRPRHSWKSWPVPRSRGAWRRRVPTPLPTVARRIGSPVGFSRDTRASEGGRQDQRRAALTIFISPFAPRGSPPVWESLGPLCARPA